MRINENKTPERLLITSIIRGDKREASVVSKRLTAELPRNSMRPRSEIRTTLFI